MIDLIDNVIDSKYQDFLESLIINAELPLYYNVDSCDLTGYGVKPDNNTIMCPQFTHTFVRNKEVTSDFWNIFQPVVYNLAAQTGLGLDMTIERSKLNFNYQNSVCTDNQYLIPHVDVTTMEGITAVYYVSDSDGDTIFFDNDQNIIKTITPKKGSIVVFDNNIFHAGKPPKNSKYKCLLNINWVKS